MAQLTLKSSYLNFTPTELLPVARASYEYYMYIVLITCSCSQHTTALILLTWLILILPQLYPCALTCLSYHIIVMPYVPLLMAVTTALCLNPSVTPRALTPRLRRWPVTNTSGRARRAGGRRPPWRAACGTRGLVGSGSWPSSARSSTGIR